MDLKKFSERTGKTFSAIAQELDLTPSLVSQWHRGKSMPGYDHVCKLLDLGMSFEELFGEERWMTLKQKIEANASKSLSGLSNEDCVYIVKTAFKELSK